MKFRSKKHFTRTAVLFLGICVGYHLVEARKQAEPAVLPMVASAVVPLYPPLARATNIQGVIHVQVSTDGHQVATAHAQEDIKPLSVAAEENSKTWQFSAHTPVTFTISYHYKLSKQCNPNNPTVILRLPTDVEICQYPFNEY